MKKIHLLLYCLLFLGSVQFVFGQGGGSRDARLRTKGYVNPQEIVSLDSSMRISQALLVIGELSKQYAGKIIIDLEKHQQAIGVVIVNQHWRDALDMILAHHGLTYVEEPEYIRILPMGATSAVENRGPGSQVPTEPPPTLQSRDVKISAVFFNTNVSKLQNYGISWNFFRSKTKEPTEQGFISSNIGRSDSLPAGTPPGTLPQHATPSLETAVGVLRSPPEFTFANVDLLIKFFGTNQLGEVLTSPELVVRDGKKGRIQVGKDIFITTRDIAGNTINQELSTGTIIDVTPTIYTQNDTDFIYLNLGIEQSDVSPGPEINRTAVNTHTLLFDGEETVIGGLVTTQDQEIREGVPFLKDLPWWFLGLRYIFGSESTVRTKNELIILLKAELLQPIRSRISTTRTTPQELINSKRKEYSKEYDKK